jgi:hypothetical protein
MPKLSYEGFIGTVLALIVLILDEAGVRNAYVLWIAFILALGFCLDGAIRSGWDKRHKSLASVGIVLAYVLFAVYLVYPWRPWWLSTPRQQGQQPVPLPLSPTEQIKIWFDKYNLAVHRQDTSQFSAVFAIETPPPSSQHFFVVIGKENNKFATIEGRVQLDADRTNQFKSLPLDQAEKVNGAVCGALAQAGVDMDCVLPNKIYFQKTFSMTSEDAFTSALADMSRAMVVASTSLDVNLSHHATNGK